MCSDGAAATTTIMQAPEEKSARLGGGVSIGHQSQAVVLPEGKATVVIFVLFF